MSNVQDIHHARAIHVTSTDRTTRVSRTTSAAEGNIDSHHNVKDVCGIARAIRISGARTNAESAGFMRRRGVVVHIRRMEMGRRLTFRQANGAIRAVRPLEQRPFVGRWGPTLPTGIRALIHDGSVSQRRDIILVAGRDPVTEFMQRDTDNIEATAGAWTGIRIPIPIRVKTNVNFCHASC